MAIDDVTDPAPTTEPDPAPEPAPTPPPVPLPPPSDDDLLAIVKAKRDLHKASADAATAADKNRDDVTTEQDTAVGAAIAKRNELVDAATLDASNKHAAEVMARADMDAAIEALIADLKAQE